MNIVDARLILDMVRAGAGEQIPETMITQALCITGDISGSCPQEIIPTYEAIVRGDFRTEKTS